MSDKSSIEENGNEVIEDTQIEKPSTKTKKKKILTEKQKEALEKGRRARQENLNRLSKIVKKEKIKKLQEEIGEEEPQRVKSIIKKQQQPKPKKKVVYTYQSETDDDDDDDDNDDYGNQPTPTPQKINKPIRKPKLNTRNNPPPIINNEPPEFKPSFFFV